MHVAACSVGLLHRTVTPNVQVACMCVALAIREGDAVVVDAYAMRIMLISGAFFSSDPEGSYDGLSMRHRGWTHMPVRKALYLIFRRFLGALMAALLAAPGKSLWTARPILLVMAIQDELQTENTIIA